MFIISDIIFVLCSSGCFPTVSSCWTLLLEETPWCPSLWVEQLTGQSRGSGSGLACPTVNSGGSTTILRTNRDTHIHWPLYQKHLPDSSTIKVCRYIWVPVSTSKGRAAWEGFVIKWTGAVEHCCLGCFKRLWTFRSISSLFKQWYELLLPD